MWSFFSIEGWSFFLCLFLREGQRGVEVGGRDVVRRRAGKYIASIDGEWTG